MALSKYICIWVVRFVFLKNYKFKDMFGVILFVFVFVTGFVKMNIVYSSTGIGRPSAQEIKAYSNGDYIDTLSTITDKAFIKIYEENYGYDIVFNIFDRERVFCLRLPWRKD